MTTGPAEPGPPGSGELASLEGAKVVLGVSGGIAAYKAVEVCRRLVAAGAHVVPVLTPSALRFVGAETFSALASEPALSEIFEAGPAAGSRRTVFGRPAPILHTALGRSADLVVVAPATARLVGCYAAGIPSDLLVATLVATAAPVLVCPAMHTEMWEHPSTQENIGVLERRGVHVLSPARGRLAGGDSGAGRLPEPEEIVAAAAGVLAAAAGVLAAAAGVLAASARPRVAGMSGGERAARCDMSGLRILVTAGGTREPIDPVRYIGNRSSGKQGHAVAEAAAARGAEVVLVTAARLPAPPGVEVIAVETSAEMASEVLSRAGSVDIVVMAAAVADFRPKEVAPSKLKKSDGVPEIVLEPTVDILSELGRRRAAARLPVLVGFAAETEDLAERAAAKLAEKRIDVVVGNDVSAERTGFSHDTNAVTIVTAEAREGVPLQSKRRIAEVVLDAARGAFETRARSLPDAASDTKETS